MMLKKIFNWSRSPKVDPMKYLIVGLGNIGSEYEDTRHNIGFNVLDELAKQEGLKFENLRYGAVCEYRFKGKTLVLLKPSTYMNLSGKAIRYWMQQEKIKPENLLVVVDDLALPFESIRMRQKGSDAGHNGLKNIQEIFGHSNYSRIRYGIGDNFSRGKQIDYVLGKWSSDEMAALPEGIDHAITMIKGFATIGPTRTMNQYNKK